ncbi:DNA packaging tegument protein UL25 [Spheniscid alphaherpesvirus 1]|uniref:DNA packaging tegument protein UL25 n=1 Tax=Spheniscid alphaherpesvirus 1 TaxID=2560777 RepID=A0A1R3T8A5_9ALPH|nr:DNA packaging tegument protein UL25 [Spheniscid alphaherpesvirus 1]SCO83558.1 DNA packaging tegument protein UL25 [Spheniscid alphaherpesvirus 1]
MAFMPFGPLRLYDGGNIYIPDSRSFIAPKFPAGFWTSPVFNPPPKTADQRIEVLRARHTAASAALDNLGLKAIGIPEELERRLRPLEEQVTQVADALAALEAAASAAEAADAAADADRTSCREYVEQDCVAANESREVQISKNDSPLRYDSNLPVDFLSMVYVGRGAGGSSGVLFGTWYRALQDCLIAEHPTATRSIDYRDSRMSKTFMTTAVVSLQSCGRLYVGARHYSAFECAVLCLYLTHRAIVPHESHENNPVSFSGLVERLSLYIDTLSVRISNCGSRLCYRYNADKLPRGQFAAVSTNGRYERGALDGHIVLATLISLKVLPSYPGAIPREGPSREIDADYHAYVDDVNRAASAFLGRAQNLFLMEDQTLLRATINTITALLLLRRLLWNGNVYADKLKNSFQLGTLIPGAIASDGICRGADGGLPRGMVKSNSNNLSFICQQYVLPLYRADNSVEVSQLFPGLVALCLDAQSLRAQGAVNRHVLDVSTRKYQIGLTRLIALELENRSRAFTTPIHEVIGTHDAVALQYEHGLGLLMQQPRLKSALEENRRLTQFNVTSDYDLLYFVCLGFIPLFASTA